MFNTTRFIFGSGQVDTKQFLLGVYQKHKWVYFIFAVEIYCHDMRLRQKEF